MRESLKEFCSKFKKNSVIKAIEIGVMAGDNAHQIYNNLFNMFVLDKLYLIDTWSTAYRPEMLDRLLKVATRFDNIGNVCIIRDDSLAVCDFFKNESIDYLYLDNSHNPDHVFNELCRWYPKVSKGGMLAGHDINPDFPDRVEGAVKKYCDEYNLRYYKKINDKEIVGDWWIWKQ